MQSGTGIAEEWNIEDKKSTSVKSNICTFLVSVLYTFTYLFAIMVQLDK